ncbi:MAG: hypothetical protein SGJ20_20030, partial [Planctomycetota bacterium]|nr:hypothetical protein [Planctomycetota bacterium]
MNRWHAIFEDSNVIRTSLRQIRCRIGGPLSLQLLPCLLIGALTVLGCNSSSTPKVDSAAVWPPEKLSAFELFEGNGASQQPRAGVMPYDLNSPLFSDYTQKL